VPVVRGALATQALETALTVTQAGIQPLAHCLLGMGAVVVKGRVALNVKLEAVGVHFLRVLQEVVSPVIPFSTLQALAHKAVRLVVHTRVQVELQVMFLLAGEGLRGQMQQLKLAVLRFKEELVVAMEEIVLVA
jgi:hypothetical protein